MIKSRTVLVLLALASFFLFPSASEAGRASHEAPPMPSGLFDKICGYDLARGTSAIHTWGTPGGIGQYYALHPGIQRGHAPVIYFDSKGEEVLTVPMFPVERGKKYPVLEKRDALLKGLEDLWTSYCH